MIGQIYFIVFGDANNLRMPKFGNLSEFNAYSEDDWPSYIEQMNHANDIADDGKNRSVLLGSFRPPIQTVINNLVSPRTANLNFSIYSLWT